MSNGASIDFVDEGRCNQAGKLRRNLAIMNADDYFTIAKEISDGFRSSWDSLGSAYQVKWHMRESAERVFFETLIDVVNGHKMPVIDVVEMLKIYLKHADWIGILVRDSSPMNGNGSKGPTWALVRPSGILASFGDSTFQTIYEPLYDEHEEDEEEEEEEDWDYADDDPSPEERREKSNETHERYLKRFFGLAPDEDEDPEDQRITLLPKGFRNPLLVEHFANGSSGQEVVAVSRRTHIRDRTSSVEEWINKHRDNNGIAASFDILATAALDYHRKRPLLRQLRSWTEEEFLTVVDTVMMMASVWPEYLGGKLTFVSGHHRSWIVVDQKEKNSLLFSPENKPVRASLSRILSKLSGIGTFRAMTCGFDLSRPGQVVHDGKAGEVMRLIANDIQPSAEERRRAIARLIQRLVDFGYDREFARASISDPVAIGNLVDQSETLLRQLRQQSLFERPTSRQPIKSNPFRGGGHILEERSSDRLYNAVGGNGRDRTYLSDGLWISPDGSISDDGR